MLKEEIIFPGSGLDTDSDERFLSKGDSNYRLHMIPNQFGAEYVLTNLKGNTQKSHSFSHDSDYAGAYYTCIGTCYDDVRDAIYLFIHSSFGNHSILRFNFNGETFDKICFDHTGLGFELEYPITDAFMIGDWLHFNPRTSSPRAINVQWAYYDWVTYTPFTGVDRAPGDYVRYFNKVYVALATTDSNNPPSVPEEYEFVDYCYEDTYPVNGNALDGSVTSSTYFKYRDFYNTPTLHPQAPTTEVSTNSSYEYNNIRGRRFQFCFRHYVKDQGYTISSQYTDIIAAPAQETNLGEIEGDITSWNEINVSIPSQFEQYGTYWYDHNTLLEFAEILFREGPDDDWKVAERIRHTDIVDKIVSTGKDFYTVSFLNDRAYEVVDNASVDKGFNALPITADSQWSLDGERSAYGGITEGRDLTLETDVTMTPGEREIAIDVKSGATLDTTNGTHTFTKSWNETTQKWDYVSGTITNSGVAQNEVIQCTPFGQTFYKKLTAATYTNSEYADAIVELLAAASIQAVNSGGGTITISFSFDFSFDSFAVYRYTSSSANSTAYKAGSFKNGAWHLFCLLYYDDILRMDEPVVDDDMRVYVETLPEVLDDTQDSTNYQRYIEWEINHKPPPWAKYWRWGYAGNQTIQKFWQYNVAAVTYNQTRGNGTDTWTSIDISPLQNLADDTDTSLDHYFPNSTIDAYSWEPGDRMRFVTKDIAVPSDYDGLRVAASNDDYEILEYDDINHLIYIDDLAGPVSNPQTIIIEIYRPKKQTGTTVYYEFGELYKTYEDSNGELAHRGPLVDQDGATGAEGRFDSGDVFVISRLFSLDFNTPAGTAAAVVESASWSDFHDSEGWGKGKAGIYTGIGQKYLNNIRYGNRYSPNSQVSGVSTFDFLDYAELGFDYGKITAMRQVGHTLRVIFERNTASVMVNRTQFVNADGVSQILKSDQVLGSVQYSDYHYGTVFPESVTLRDRTVYFFDVYRDAFVQDSPNGVIPISDNKMRKYFRDKAAIIRTTGVENVTVFSGYDYVQDLLFVVFDIDDDADRDNCILYHDKTNRWVSHHAWETDISETEFPLAMTTPETAGTSGARISMSYSFSYGLNTTNFSTTDTDTWSGTHFFTGTSNYHVNKGASITVTAYVTGDAALYNLISFVITDPDGGDTAVMSNYVGSGNTYTYTNTASKSGYLQITCKLSGSGAVTSGDACSVFWLPSVSQTVMPKMAPGVAEFCSVIGEDLYIHNDSATYNNFWGVQYDSKLKVVGNVAPNVVKEFLAMAIHTNKPWDVEQILIPATINYPDGMESEIPEGRFEEDEGVLRSDYLCNMKTTSSSTSILDLLNGDNLRGYIIEHTLVNDDTTEVYLFKVDVSSLPSKM
jgi:L-rhamnose mutarotase